MFTFDSSIALSFLNRLLNTTHPQDDGIVCKDRNSCLGKCIWHQLLGLYILIIKTNKLILKIFQSVLNQKNGYLTGKIQKKLTRDNSLQALLRSAPMHRPNKKFHINIPDQ